MKINYTISLIDKLTEINENQREALLLCLLILNDFKENQRATPINLKTISDFLSINSNELKKIILSLITKGILVKILDPHETENGYFSPATYLLTDNDDNYIEASLVDNHLIFDEKNKVRYNDITIIHLGFLQQSKFDTNTISLIGINYFNKTINQEKQLIKKDLEINRLNKSILSLKQDIIFPLMKENKELKAKLK